MKHSTLARAAIVGAIATIATPSLAGFQGATTYPGSVCKMRNFQSLDTHFDFDTYSTSIRNTDSAVHDLLCPVHREDVNGSLYLAVMDVTGTAAQWSSAGCTFRAQSADGASRWLHPDTPAMSNRPGGTTIVWEGAWNPGNYAAYAFYCSAVPAGLRVEKLDVEEGSSNMVDAIIAGSNCKLAAPQSTDDSMKFGSGSTLAPAAIANYASSNREVTCPLHAAIGGNSGMRTVTVNVNEDAGWASNDCNYYATSWNGTSHWGYFGMYEDDGPGARFTITAPQEPHGAHAIRCAFRPGGWLYNIRIDPEY